MAVTPASPPKRMTRARAKAVEEKKQAAPRPVERTTAASRARAKSTQDAETDATAKRTKEAPKKTPATRKTATAAPKTRTRQAAKAPATRAGKAQKEAEPEPEAEPEEEEQPEEAPAVTTRGRARKNTLTDDAPPAKKAQPATRATRTTAKSTAASKKKVAFRDDDKENQVDELALKRLESKDGNTVAAATKSTAPAKKQVPAPAAAKPIKDNAKKNVETDKPRLEPLSPKKGFQTAAPTGRPTSSGQDSAPTDQPRMSSPAKKPLNVRQEMYDEDELDMAQSPTKEVPRANLASPAKRPPESIQKQITTATRSLRDCTLDDISSANDTGIMSASPRKMGALVATATPSTRVAHIATGSSILTQSPAKRPPSPIKSFGRSMMPATPRDENKSLLQSPARRPPATIQSFQFGSTRKTDDGHGPSQNMTASRLQKKPMKFDMPPPRNPFASPDRLRAAVEARSSPKSPEVTKVAPEDLTLTTQPDPMLIDNNDENENSDEDVFTTARNKPSLSQNFEFRTLPVEWSSDAESEDELQSQDPQYDASPKRRHSRPSAASSAVPATPAFAAARASLPAEGAVPMTVLAERFEAWTGATPNPKELKARNAATPVFHVPEHKRTTIVPPSTSPIKTFDDAMEIHEDDSQDEGLAPEENADDIFRISQSSESSQEYGDENEAPTTSAAIRPAPSSPGPTVTPSNLTSKRQTIAPSSVFKVPLKPADDELAARRKGPRSKSMSGVLTPSKRRDLDAPEDVPLRQAQTARTSRFAENLDENEPPETPMNAKNSMAAAMTPGRTPRPNLNPKLLCGAVVFVDVHTTEGADASEIFVDLLGQMGARCVKSWNWNPAGSDDVDSDTRVGITHVVFKDGGIKTMERVRMAKGLVQCVGVGWVLDCERENKWMDETEYTIDEGYVPRGGHRRRKSMEPRRVSNLNGTLSTSSSPRKLSGSLSPSSEFLNLESPAKGDKSMWPIGTPRRVNFAPEADEEEDELTPQQQSYEPYVSRPVHPYGTPPDRNRPRMSDVGELSPTTPYFLHADQLVQHTCPPKQTQQLFFPVSGNIEETSDAELKMKLMAARRKSLQFAPKVGSPLARKEH